ncbi:formin homology 2 domain-containing protein [Ditylenchus destructor]|uniref:Formin homology 2 domain-containing protein n=1 Tax=Ditylenchus destructor TaxID=166010 RepID=A0AAD4MZH1_9BILA|nr:formin homology 2 domain-containing protein [Ditylenchus destructor]
MLHPRSLRLMRLRRPLLELFVATLATINALPIRLESIQLKLCWNDTVSELKSTISAIAEACDEIKQSKGLTHFVSFVLLAGNYMGKTKTSKDAFAFELSALCKLIDTKDSENSETLLHSLIILLDKKLNGRYTNFAIEDFHHITKASRSDLGETQKTKDSLKNTLKKVADYVSKYVKQSESDKFLDKLGSFVEQAQKEISVVEGMWDNMQMKWTLLQKYLCFDQKKYPMEKLFGDLKQFQTHYETALRDINRAKENKKKKQAAAVKKREPFKSIQPANMPKGTAEIKADQDTGGVIDKIEQMLEQGRYRPGGQRTPRESKMRLSSKFPVNESRTENEENTRQVGQTGGYRVRRKGQPTVFVPPQDSDNPRRNLQGVNDPKKQNIPTTEELLKQLNSL